MPFANGGEQMLEHRCDTQAFCPHDALERRKQLLLMGSRECKISLSTVALGHPIEEPGEHQERECGTDEGENEELDSRDSIKLPE